MKKSLIILILNCLILNFVFSQSGVSVNRNGAPADNSAILDVSSTSQGLLIPRLTTTQRDNITSPALSLIIFNTTTNCFEAYVNGSWYSVSCPPPCSQPTAPIAGASLPSETQIAWNWNYVNGATGYKWNIINNYATATDNGSSNAFTQTGLTCNTGYTLYVWAYNSCGNSSASALTSTSSSCCGNAYVCGGDGTFVDARDGQTYGYVNIGSQTWMCQNLNYGIYTSAANYPQQSGYKFCYQNNPCCPTGGLYEWDNLMQSHFTCNGTGQSQPPCSAPVQGLCPAGWHIPSYFEWIQFDKAVDSNPAGFSWILNSSTSTGNWYGTDIGHKLKSTSWADGTNTSRFSALLGGDSSLGLFYLTNGTAFWTSSEDTFHDSTWAWWTMVIDYPVNAGEVNIMTFDKKTGASVRCVKN
jgi:uncharacterized protein (TIGR02145 family)